MQDNVSTRIVRIFNTFGPRMNPEDGRVVSNFIMQALKNESLVIYGDGNQTRSFQYIHDLIDGLLLAMENDYQHPINLGNPQEFKIVDLANIIIQKINKDVKVSYSQEMTDDPKRRKPDIGRAKLVLGWQPKFSLEQGLNETIEYFKLLLTEKL
jgi:UDP-glucuronate decarboxylase